MIDKSKIEAGVKLLLEGIGEDLTREGLVGTPERIARMYEEIFAGMEQSPKEHLEKKFTEDSAGHMVLEKDISFYSMCEHHLAPFFGKVHIAYVPNKEVVGISKLARTVEVYAKRPQLQERLTNQIAEAIMEYLAPQGVMVMIEAEHTCMTMRGVKKPGTKTVTYVTKGCFAQNDSLKQDFLQMVKG